MSLAECVSATVLLRGCVAELELASVLRQLRMELNETMADAEGERLRFEMGPVELSLPRPDSTSLPFSNFHD